MDRLGFRELTSHDGRRKHRRRHILGVKANRLKLVVLFYFTKKRIFFFCHFLGRIGLLLAFGFIINPSIFMTCPTNDKCFIITWPWCHGCKKTVNSK